MLFYIVSLTKFMCVLFDASKCEWEARGADVYSFDLSRCKWEARGADVYSFDLPRCEWEPRGAEVYSLTYLDANGIMFGAEVYSLTCLDANGNHVVQKCMVTAESTTSPHMEAMLSRIQGRVLLSWT